MLFHLLLKLSIVTVMSVVLASCSSEPLPSRYYSAYSQPVAYGQSGMNGGRASLTASELLRQVNVKKDYIPYGRHARKYRRRMTPRYITIHSTQNYSRSADAWQHSKALKNGKLRAYKSQNGNRIGYLVWHFSIDQYRVVQHLPENEQGEHADFDGPGNNYSLGLEMCENSGNNRAATVERTAKLAAYLMQKYNIPVRNVVPHYHWPRKGLSKPNKNCPHFLLDNGRPGRKWRAFQDKVQAYYKQISQPQQLYYNPQQYQRPAYPVTPQRPSYPQYQRSATPRYLPNPYGVPALRY